MSVTDMIEMYSGDNEELRKLDKLGLLAPFLREIGKGNREYVLKELSSLADNVSGGGKLDHMGYMKSRYPERFKRYDKELTKLRKMISGTERKFVREYVDHLMADLINQVHPGEITALPSGGMVRIVSSKEVFGCKNLRLGAEHYLPIHHTEED